MSQEGYDKLVAELQRLESVERPKASAAIAEARDKGDLSENSEYDEAKNEQGKLYSKIAEIKDLIENAVITENGTGNSVVMGSRITVREVGEEETESFQIVGSQEADPIRGRISDESPLGRSLMGHVKGDKVTFEAPVGVLHYEIISVEN
jgi:transcription elongation factor GreA